MNAGLIRWEGDGPEPCDGCERPVYRTDCWVAYRNPHAPGGVRFLCCECWEEPLQGLPSTPAKELPF